MKKLLEKHGINKPIWVTEFTVKEENEEKKAETIVTSCTVGFWKGVEKVFYTAYIEFPKAPEDLKLGSLIDKEGNDVYQTTPLGFSQGSSMEWGTGILIDMIRCLKIAKDMKIGGPLYEASAFFCKHPPKSYPNDDLAYDALIRWIKKVGEHE